MTNANQLLIEENMNLVHKYCAIHNITDEDVKQDLFLTVCEGIDKYDPSKGTLGTFIYTICKNRLILVHSKKFLKKTIPDEIIFSLDAPITSNNSEDNMTFEELNGLEDSELDKIEAKDFAEKFIKAYEKFYPNNTKMVERIKKYLAGQTFKSIAEEEGVNHASISFAFKQLKEFYNCYINNDFTSIIEKTKTPKYKLKKNAAFRRK